MDTSVWRDRTRIVASREIWAMPLTLLGLAVLAFGLPVLLLIPLDGQVDYNEGWNAMRQHSAASGVPLYAALPDRAVTNYPPLSFHLVGLLGRWIGSTMLAGRLTAVFSVAVITGLVVRLGWTLSGSPWVAACCGLCWVSGLEVVTPYRIVANDPQLMGMAVQLAGLVLLLRSPRGRWQVMLGAILASLGLFTKIHLLAMPLGVTAWLVWDGRRHLLSVWLLSGLSTCLVLLTASLWLDGTLMFSHLLAPRLFLPAQTLYRVMLYAVTALPALLTIAIGIRHGLGEPVRPLLWIEAAALLEIVAFAGGDGVAGNITQDSLLFTALLQPLALHRILRGRDRIRLRHRDQNRLRRLAMVSASVLPSGLFLGLIASGPWQRWHDLRQQQPAIRRMAERLHAADGPVMCEALALCFEAGRDSDFDAYFTLDQIRLGRMNSTRIDQPVWRQGLAAIEVGTPDDPERTDPRTRPWRFTASFMRALRTSYTPVASVGGMTLFVPKPLPSPPHGNG